MRLGIDRGSIYTKGILLSGKRIVIKWEFDGSVPIRDAVRSILKDCLKEGVKAIPVGFVNLPYELGKKVDVFTALKEGVVFLHPPARTVIEVGGERARMLKIGESGEIEDFMLAERCASGTGLFIETQAKRLNLSLSELSDISLKAEKPAKVAGRCAVFAKSDMIHLQQKGVPVEEIAYGLLYAVAFNLVSTLLRGKEVIPPLFVAGGASRNEGLLRALKEILKGVEIVQSQFPGFECAIGSALRAQSPVELEKLLEEVEGDREFSLWFAEPLSMRNYERSVEPSEVYMEKKRGYIGIDVGSVSTDIVVIDECGNLLSAVYLPTRGKPAEVLVEGFKIIKERFKGGLEVLGACTTGSGRYLARALVNADLAKNEISTQMKGALFYFPDADTIFEIGGQDSKFISIRNGKLLDFTMNKVCAAGTGSFIEEQASLLGIDVKSDYSKLAFSSSSPVPLCPNCTVFMERTISNWLYDGTKVEDICAGLAYAVVRNYLTRVVGGKRIGEKIVFQGGVASNDAVVSAFEKVLGKKIYVHPYNRLSGAIGAALYAMECVKGKSTFRFPDEIPEKMRTFECKKCSNFCDVTVIKVGGGYSFFGDTCERFTSGRGRTKRVETNLAEEFIKEGERYFDNIREGRAVIGIPRASTFLAYLPFWATFFKELGFKPVLSPPSSRSLLLRSAEYLQAVTCLPVKFVAGHISYLVEVADYVFVPSIYKFEDERYSCPYTQSLPYMMKEERKIISPVLSMDEDGFVRGFKDYEKELSISSSSVASAFRRAIEVQKDFERRMAKRVEEVIRGGGKKVVVIGRPYNIYDPYLNLNLFSHLEREGLRAIPMNLFPYTQNTEPFFLWKFSEDSLRALINSLKENDCYPVIVSNFGCGPDAFSHKVFEEVIGDYPSLFLEFDEHRGEAGLITRIEAFRDLIEERSFEGRKIYLPSRVSLTVNELREKKVYLPYFADHVYAFSGVLKYAGVDARVLPLPDTRIKEKGERESSGKECHAYSILLGDLIELCEKEKDNFVYFFPGTKIPCLLNQYSTGMNLFLKKHSIKNAVVYSPVGEEFMRIIGMKGAERFYKGLFSIDALHKVYALIKPFERNKGTADRIYRNSLKRIEESIVRGDIYEAFNFCMKELEGIEMVYEDRPFVGVAGDIYTRVNSSANFNLFDELIKRGLVGVPSPFEIDIIDYGIYRSFSENLREGRLRNVIQSGLLLLRKSVEMRKFERRAMSFLGRWDEPSYRKLIRLAERYTSNPYNELFYLNVGKMVDFAEKGVCGIINATCFNCMVGTASSAVVEKIKRDYRIPVITLVYAGHHDPDVDVLLDVFAEEVMERYRSRLFIAGIGGT